MELHGAGPRDCREPAGRLAEGEAAYRARLLAQPGDARTWQRLGMLLHQAGRTSEALEALGRSIELEPHVGAYHGNLGGVLGSMGEHARALEHLTRAVELDASIPEVHHNLGVACEHLGQLEQAAAAHRRAIALRPDYAEAHNHLGNALRKHGKTAAAAECHRRAIALRPGYAEAYNNLAAALVEQGDQEGAAACHRRAVEIEPHNPAAHSALLYTLHYCASSTPQALLEEAKGWAQRHGRFEIAPHENDRDPDRTLRIGYVSPDFREHTVPRIVAPILRFHDRQQVEVFCYSAARQPDHVTERLRGYADYWRDISKLTEERAAELVRSDRIDILVDLAGHWAENRMTLFARKPAPVQVQIGYPGTTGLEAMDWRITDSHCDPPGMTERFYTEKLWRMSQFAWCYEPDEDGPQVGPLPAQAAGFVTFGCLNNPIKVTDECLRLWGRVLEAVPRSRLLLLSAEGREDGFLFARLKRLGIDPARVDPVRRRTRVRYLELFGHIDVALDPFPYNGETTTCDGLWMGVPHLTLAGSSCVSRRGVSHLSNVGLSELVCQSEEQLVGKAVELACDLERLGRLRSELRPRMRSGPITDGPGYTRDLERAYRQMWRVGAQ